MIYTPQNVEEHRKCEDQSGLQNLRPLFDPHLPSQTHMEASRLERRELPRSLRISPALFIRVSNLPVDDSPSRTQAVEQRGKSY